MLAKYTIRQDTSTYQIWHFMSVLACLWSSLAYPYYTMISFRIEITWSVIFLMLTELFFLIDMVLCFFKQEIDESGNSKMDPLSVTTKNYLHKRFLIDLLALLPIGLVAQIIDDRLGFLWVLKAIRIGQLNQLLKDRMLSPIINRVIEKKQKKFLDDEHKREDII